MTRAVVSIAIVNWNTRDLLRACLRSLPWDSAEVELDVIVVDNASRDDSVAMVRREFPAVRLLRNRSNLGFVRANNQALAAGRGDFLFMLNSDTEVRAGAIERLLQVLAAHPHVGAVGPRLLNGDGSPQVSTGPFPRLLHRWLPGRFETRYARDLEQRLAASPEPLAAVDWLGGAAVLTTRRVLARIGALDERFYMWYDDLDWSRRLARAGLERWFVGDAVVVHHGRQSGAQLANRTLAAQLLRSEYTYLRLHDGVAATWAAMALRVAKAAAQLMKPGAAAKDEARWRLRLHANLWSQFGCMPVTNWPAPDFPSSPRRG